MEFTARVIGGSRRGRSLGFPTINLDLRSIPEDIKHGIYAGYATFSEEPRAKKPMSQEANEPHPAAIHYGPRLFHDEGLSFEVHIINQEVPGVPKEVTVTMVERLRDVRNFPDEQALEEQIRVDIERARAILCEP